MFGFGLGYHAIDLLIDRAPWWVLPIDSEYSRFVWLEVRYQILD